MRHAPSVKCEGQKAESSPVKQPGEVINRRLHRAAFQHFSILVFDLLISAFNFLF
jgi:hypothetical protein